MAASLLPDSTLCIFPSPLPFIFSSVPFLLTYLSCSPSQVDIGSVGLFSSVDKARLSFGAENWSSDLFVCPVSFPCHLGVGSNPDEYRCNGGSWSSAIYPAISNSSQMSNGESFPIFPTCIHSIDFYCNPLQLFSHRPSSALTMKLASKPRWITSLGKDVMASKEGTAGRRFLYVSFGTKRVCPDWRAKLDISMI